MKFKILYTILILSFSEICQADLQSDWVLGCKFGMKTYSAREQINFKVKDVELEDLFLKECQDRFKLVEKDLSAGEKKNPIEAGCGFAVGALFRSTKGFKETAKLMEDQKSFLELVNKHCIK